MVRQHPPRGGLQTGPHSGGEVGQVADAEVGPVAGIEVAEVEEVLWVDAAEVLAQLTGAGLRVTADGDNLRIAGPTGALTPQLRDVVRTHKHELLALLTVPAPAVEGLRLSELFRAAPVRQVRSKLLGGSWSSPRTARTCRPRCRGWLSTTRASCAT